MGFVLNFFILKKKILNFWRFFSDCCVLWCAELYLCIFRKCLTLTKILQESHLKEHNIKFPQNFMLQQTPVLIIPGKIFRCLLHLWMTLSSKACYFCFSSYISASAQNLTWKILILKINFDFILCISFNRCHFCKTHFWILILVNKEWSLMKF